MLPVSKHPLFASIMSCLSTQVILPFLNHPAVDRLRFKIEKNSLGRTLHVHNSHVVLAAVACQKEVFQWKHLGCSPGTSHQIFKQTFLFAKYVLLVSVDYAPGLFLLLSAHAHS